MEVSAAQNAAIYADVEIERSGVCIDLLGALADMAMLPSFLPVIRHFLSSLPSFLIYFFLPPQPFFNPFCCHIFLNFPLFHRFLPLSFLFLKYFLSSMHDSFPPSFIFCFSPFSCRQRDMWRLHCIVIHCCFSTNNKFNKFQDGERSERRITHQNYKNDLVVSHLISDNWLIMGRQKVQNKIILYCMCNSTLSPLFWT